MKSEAKAIAKRIKAKGLQKLKWYCQMCEKQCRDENGFKCHTQSEGHLRQMSIFKQSSGKFMDQFSKQFEKDFLNILSRRHNTKRVRANIVYNEFIQDRDHVHMNATYWGTLSTFVQYLGREGKCTVDETEKGWYIAWIDNDPETLARLAKGEKKKQHDQDDEDRHRKEIEKQIAASKANALERGVDLNLEKFTELKSDSSINTLEISIQKKKKKKTIGNLTKNESSNNDKTKSADPGKNKIPTNNLNPSNVLEKKRKNGTAMENIVQRMEQRKRPKDFNGGIVRSDSIAGSNNSHSHSHVLVDGCWFHKGIVVKLTDKSFGQLRKSKAVITHVSQSIIGSGKLQLINKKDKNALEDSEVRINQTQVETVVPKLGGTVVIVSKDPSFKYRGLRCKLVDIDIDKYSVSVKLLEGGDIGRVVNQLDYENISKLF